MAHVPFPTLGGATTEIGVAANSSSNGLVLGIAADDDHVVAVGGQGRDLYMMSDDGGRTFRDVKSPGRGLRSAWVSGDDVWVCGEWGYAAHSPDRGQSWQTIETDAGACLFGVGVDDAGHVWLAGDDGFLVHVSPSGETTEVELTEAGFSRFSTHPEGFLAPCDDGDEPATVFLVSQRSQRKLGVDAENNFMKARLLDSGTIMAVGGGGIIFRSTDGGESFQSIESPARGLLCSVEALSDGRVVVVGQSGGVYVSNDDGASFEKIEQEHSSDYLWCCERIGDRLLVGAHRGTVLEIR